MLPSHGLPLNNSLHLCIVAILWYWKHYVFKLTVLNEKVHAHIACQTVNQLYHCHWEIWLCSQPILIKWNIECIWVSKYWCKRMVTVGTTRCILWCLIAHSCDIVVVDKEGLPLQVKEGQSRLTILCKSVWRLLQWCLQVRPSLWFRWEYEN